MAHFTRSKGTRVIHSEAEDRENESPAQIMPAQQQVMSHGNREKASHMPHSFVPPPQHGHQEFQHDEDNVKDERTNNNRRRPAPRDADATLSQQCFYFPRRPTKNANQRDTGNPRQRSQPPRDDLDTRAGALRKWQFCAL